ncbi:DUF4844 domain-containing protein [Flavobacterium sp. SM15]|uniref:DUF4844 domain-containing protein n=1 Tax=Flavobacterium sp. SM15 TaxID=2908005 RepID=UPI001EDBE4C8|nr:DUF4844 domain-containing protein [Flavobacterium sp. SM15]MCG2612585.1 DUF4844 domain-containing protein [Flavobacterium sp. SM15]
MTNTKFDKLKYLLEKKKFADSEWEKRGLNPSSSELCEQMENKLDLCLSSLINLVEHNSSQSDLKKALRQSLKTFDKSNFDTEEKDFICDYFYQISKSIDIDFKNELNKWLYGSVLNSLLKISELIKGKEKVIETLSQDCTKCNSNLETFILEKDDEIPDSDFFIVKCKSCGEYNLIDKGPKIKRLKFGEYELTEQLSRNDYNLEEAKIRLKQIQYFRK